MDGQCWTQRNRSFADLTALAFPSPQKPIDNIVGWRNYAMTQRTGASFGSFNYSSDNNCAAQDFYGSYLLNFGDPPFGIDSISDMLLASLYPFTCEVANQTDTSNPRTDQALTTRQELLNKALDNPAKRGRLQPKPAPVHGNFFPGTK